MKTKLLLIISLFLIAISGIHAQISLSGSIVDGQIPVDFQAYYSYSQQIIPRYQINASAGGNITALTFNLSKYGGLSGSNSWTVYLGHTSKFSFNSYADWIPVSAMTQVFNGTVTYASGAIKVTFTTPFAYNNTDNLVIAVNETNPGWDTSNSFLCYKVLPNNTMAARSFSSAIIPSSPPQATSLTDLRSFIILDGLTPNSYPACPAVLAPAEGEQLKQSNPTFTWQAVKGATGYKISVGSASGGTDVLNMQDLGNVTSYQLTANLAYSATYYYTIYAYNASGTSAGCVERTFKTIAQPPANDECANAVSLTVNPDLNYTVFTSGTTLNATNSQVTKPTCSGEPDDDVWYSFVATAVGHTVKLSNIVSVGTDKNVYATNLQGFSGSCGSLTSIGCTEWANTQALTLTGLTVGNTYYIRAYTSSKDYNYNDYRHNFDISVGTLPPPPANDNCDAAVTLTLNPDMNCASFASGNTFGATASPQAVCAGTADDDIWYKFTATQTSHYIKFSNIVSTGSASLPYLYAQVLKGNCTTFSSIFCGGANEIALTGLTVGDTYFLRVYTYGGAGHSQSFDVCAGNFPAITPPANDDCSGAQTLTVNPDINCTSVTSGNTLGATNSGISTCSSAGGTADDDVWYKFTANSVNQIFTISNIKKTGPFGYYGSTANVEIFSGSCGSLTSIYCIAQPDAGSDKFSFSVPGLVAGNTYYVRIYDSERTGYNKSFDICVATLSNDECSGALPLTIWNGLTPTQTSADTFIDTKFATNSNVPIGTCFGSPDDDLWYKFTATSASHFFNTTGIKDTGTYGSMYVDFQIFKGVCGSLVAIGCSRYSLLVSGLTIGETYYLRVYSHNNTTYRNSLYFSVQTPPAPPANDLCEGAYLANPLPYTHTQNDANGNTASPDIQACRTYSDGLWYKFTGDGTPTVIKVTGDTSDDFFNEPFIGVYTGSCGNFTCAGFMLPNDGVPTTTLTLNTTEGTVYYVNVSNGEQIESKFTINITSDKATGIFSAEKDILRITPNPTDDYFTISGLETETMLTVFDIAGKIVTEKTVVPDEKISVSTLPKGIYLVKVNNKTAKLVVK